MSPTKRSEERRLDEQDFSVELVCFHSSTQQLLFEVHTCNGRRFIVHSIMFKKIIFVSTYIFSLQAQVLFSHEQYHQPGDLKSVQV